MRKTESQSKKELEKQYVHTAISEYEYSPASEYEKSRMSAKAAKLGTLDFDPDSGVELGIDGAWVTSRVWVPKEWLMRKPALRVPGKATIK